MAAARGAALRAVDERDARALPQHFRRVVAEVERAQVQPGQVGALGQVEPRVRQVLAEQARERVPVAVEVLASTPSSHGPPRVYAAVAAITPSGDAPCVAAVGRRAQAARSASFERISCPQASPGRFHALDAETAVTACPAAVGDSVA